MEREVQVKDQELVKIRDAPSSLRTKLSKSRDHASSATDAWDAKYGIETFHRRWGWG